MLQTMPPLGLGTWKLAKKESYAVIRDAIACGYRHFDCAPIYKNEAVIGEAISSAITAKEVRRQELWLTSKLWNNAHLPRHVRPALERTLKNLQTDYLDLFLIHWPVSFRQDIEHPKRAEHYLMPSEERLLETWSALEKLVRKGLIRKIGVCNYKRERLQRLLSSASIPPACLQVECHLWLQQRELLAYCLEHNITFTAYSPLGSGDSAESIRCLASRPASVASSTDNCRNLLAFPPLIRLAERCSCTPAQLLLAWGLSRNCTLIPKAASPLHCRENRAAMPLILPQEVIAELEGYDSNLRLISGEPFCRSLSPYTLEWLWGDEGW